MPELVRLVCTVCGAPMDADVDNKGGKCKYCGSVYRFKEEKGPSLILAMNTAAGYLNRHDFDNAIVHYESILKEYPKDAEAAWGHAISTYGIVYARDDRTQRMIPTCSRIVKESILENKSYRLAISECAEEQRAQYEESAAFIDRVQKKIKRAMEDEEDFDVFISFKARGDNGIITEDSVIARNIYDELTKRGIKTFFSEVTLKNRFGDEYEPIIYRALYSCKFFILVATKEEYIEAPWVKNEWTRFRDRAADEHLTGAASAVFKKLSIYSCLPRIFQTQGIDLEKHPFDYAQLIADNLTVKFGLDDKDKKELEEQKRKNAELEARLKDLEEKRKREADEARRAEALKNVEFEEKIRRLEANRKYESRETDGVGKAEEAKQAEIKANFDIENGCLKKYKGNSKKIIIPDSVTIIDDNAFSGCTSLTSVVIGNSITSIGNSAFYDCTNLMNIVIGNNVTIIGGFAFWGCTSLTRVVIPDRVKLIGRVAFYNCTNLTSVEISDNVTSIGEMAFCDCTNLTSVEIPDSVTSIGWDAFSGCTKLSIYVTNIDNIDKWDKKWNSSNCPVFDKRTGKQLKKNSFGKWN